MKDVMAHADEDFEAIGIEGVTRQLGALFDDLAKNLMQIAKRIVWLRSQGCDVSRFERHLPGNDLQSIADGHIDPDVWLKLGSKRKVLRAVSLLPRDVQHKLIAGEPIEVAERRPDGSTHVRKVKAEDLPAELVGQVFDGSRIRNPAEQIALTIEPVSKPIIVDAPVELDVLLEQSAALLVEVKDGDKRAKKRAAARLRETAEKIALLVQ